MRLFGQNPNPSIKAGWGDKRCGEMIHKIRRRAVGYAVKVQINRGADSGGWDGGIAGWGEWGRGRGGSG